MNKPSLIGYVSGWAYGQPIIQPIDPTLVMPKGLALYAYLPNQGGEPKPETHINEHFTRTAMEARYKAMLAAAPKFGE